MANYIRTKETWSKGHIPWNKGKKGLQISWNKGKNIVKIGVINIHNERKIIKLGIRNWISYARYLVEQYINRQLTKKEIVHHIDGNSLNDQLNNLYVFKNRGEHTAFELLIKSNIIDRNYLKSNLDELKIKGGK